MREPTESAPPDQPLALRVPDFERVEAALTDLLGDRPLTGVAAAGWTLMAVVFTAIAGVVIAVILALLFGLLTQSGPGAAVGGILGLMLSLKIPARPHRDWRRRLEQADYLVTRTDGATDVRIVTDPIDVTYRLHPGGEILDAVWFDLDLPGGLQLGPRLSPTGDLAFDRHFGVEGTQLQRVCVTTELREALRPVAGRGQIIDGRFRLAISRAGLDLGPESFERLLRALRQLSIDLAAPWEALTRVARGAPFDAAQAVALLHQRGLPAPGADPALVAFVDAVLAQDAPGAMAQPDLDWSRRAEIITGLTQISSVISVDALHAAAAERAARCDATEAGRLEAASLALAARHPSLVPSLVVLGRIGDFEAAMWLGHMTFPASVEAVAQEARAAIQDRLHLGGALTLDEREALGAITVVDTGQLSEPGGSSE